MKSLLGRPRTTRPSPVVSRVIEVPHETEEHSTLSRGTFMLESSNRNGTRTAPNFRKILRVEAVLTLGMMAAVSLSAQQSPSAATSWSGVVRTAAGQAVPGAKVTVSTTQKKQTAITGADGQFSIENVTHEPHTVTVRLTGRGQTAPITVNVTGATLALTVSDQNMLSVAAAQLINSTGGSNAASGTGGEKLSSQAVSELPLNGRDFSTLLLLAAGTMTDVNGQTNFTQQFAINGQRGVEAVFAMDGADVSDPEMGGSTFTNFNVDAIQ